MGTAQSGRVHKLELAGVVCALVLSWSITLLFGGQQHMSPLWVVVAILWSALRLSGRTTALVTAAACVLAGPLTPADLATGASQPAEVWGVRALFFALTAAVASRQAARLRAGAWHDPLTGLGNRLALETALEAALTRGRRQGEALALVCLDVDDFKVVNDSFGHAAGDELLRTVAERLSRATRPGDVLARHGGDEFVVVVNGLAPERDGDSVEAVATAVVERLVEVFDSPFAVGDTALRVACSAGFSLFPGDASEPDVLHRHADAAMYAAKASDSKYARYVPSAREPLVRLSRGGRLRSAVEAGELELHYQPIFRVGGPIVGVEALVRWRDGDAGLVPPDEFIPLAEETGIIDALGDWVLHTLCDQAQAWQAEGLLPHLGLNVAPRQLRAADFAPRLMSALDASGLEPARLVLELTESAWTVDGDRNVPALEALRAAGVRVAIDDFGAGYSSLSRLRELPVDVIKVDRAFLRGVPACPQAVAIMRAIFDLASACDADVVAEGVETDSQHAFLVERGCALAQGYALARPAPGPDVTRLLREQLVASRRTTSRLQLVA